MNGIVSEDLELLKDLDGKLNCHDCAFNNEDYKCLLTRTGFGYYSIWLGTDFLQIVVPKKECDLVEIKFEDRVEKPVRINAEEIIKGVVKDIL